MFCSRCGHAVQPGQAVCMQCGLAAAPAVPAVPGLQFEVQAHAGKVKTLAICWLVYAGLAVLFNVLALTFARLFVTGPLSPFMHPQHSFGMSMPFILYIAWVATVLRAALALVAGWGLWERSEWGRIVAIIAAFFNILKFPFGTALGIWTLVLLMGYRNSSLYQQGQHN